MLIRLIRKLAECLNGVDLSHYRVGEVLDVPGPEGELLIKEGWALPSVETARRRTLSYEQLQCLRELLGRWFERQDLRRAEDRIREEIRDSRAITIRVQVKNRKR